jgi:N-acylneuraminate cytidylyltransferase
MKLCVIPARGGSKRIPRKNIKEFCGRPIIAWSIQAAINSRCFDRIIVSTDDMEIADISRDWGAEVPFIRPADLSDDYTGTASVVKHAIEYCISDGKLPEYICCIYATAPFLLANDLRKGLNKLIESGAGYAFSVTSYAFPIQRALRIVKDNYVEMFHPKYFSSRSQDLEEAYHDAGQFYWGKLDVWMDETPIFSSESVPILLPRHRVQDIDTHEDWIHAELMFNALHISNSIP